jgi:hypothetical protein
MPAAASQVSLFLDHATVKTPEAFNGYCFQDRATRRFFQKTVLSLGVSGAPRALL